MRTAIARFAVVVVALVLSGCGTASPVTPSSSPVASAPAVATGSTSSNGASVAPSAQVSASPIAGLCGQIPPSAGADTALPWGEYSTGDVPMTELFDRLKGAGLKDVVSTFQQYDPDWANAKTRKSTFCFVDGNYGEFQSNDGDADVLGSSGTYRLVDDDTIEMFSPNVPWRAHFDYKLDGTSLTLSHFVNDPNAREPFDVYVNTSFTLFPYVRRTSEP